MGFRIGDRVRAITDIDGVIKEGDIGTVVNVNQFNAGVRWDIPRYRMHDAGGDCERGYGWYVLERLMEHYISEEDDPEIGLDAVEITELYGVA